jgi:hypothetical protein
MEAKNMEIEAQSITACDVTPDGGLISLSFVDSNGQPATILMSLNQVGALIMTLPGILERALQTRFCDSTLRYAYPLASWTVEQSTDPTQCMVTLRTAEGFGVCFSIPREERSQISEALAEAPLPGVLRAN